jgi:cephalosporin hydroxylase
MQAAAKCLLFGAKADVRPYKHWMLRLTQQYLYAASTDKTWATMWWKGRRILKSPTDLWMYCEIMQKTQATHIIETGTYEGGSAEFLHDMGCALLGQPPQILTIDIAPRQEPSAKIKFLRGDSTKVPLPWDPVDMVILDSDHSYQHVSDELYRFGPLVRKGGYLIVEDSAADYVDGGPAKAIKHFLDGNPGWQVDRNCERLGLTFNPGGYLMRT